MKKILVLVLSVVFIFSFNVFAFAMEENGSFRVYGDIMPVGSYSTSITATLSAPGYSSVDLMNVSGICIYYKLPIKYPVTTFNQIIIHICSVPSHSATYILR